MLPQLRRSHRCLQFNHWNRLPFPVYRHRSCVFPTLAHSWQLSHVAVYNDASEIRSHLAGQSPGLFVPFLSNGCQIDLVTQRVQVPVRRLQSRAQENMILQLEMCTPFRVNTELKCLQNRRLAEHVCTLGNSHWLKYIFESIHSFPLSPLLPAAYYCSLTWLEPIFFFTLLECTMKAVRVHTTANPRGRGPYNVACDACARK